jgi:pyridoxine 5-phosphate synthase
VVAAEICEAAGAHGITVHPRPDQRHIHDRDVWKIREIVKTRLNLEMANAPEIVGIALKLKPHIVCLVPERRQEVTTEGGLDVARDTPRIRDGIGRLNAAGIRTSLFIAPDLRAVELSKSVGAAAIELHTGSYAHHAKDPATIRALQEAATRGKAIQLAVHAGHGLTVGNVAPVARIGEIEELNIGHSIVSRAIFVGIENAVREMRAVMDSARGSS